MNAGDVLDATVAQLSVSVACWLDSSRRCRPPVISSNCLRLALHTTHYNTSTVSPIRDCWSTPRNVGTFEGHVTLNYDEYQKSCQVKI